METEAIWQRAVLLYQQQRWDLAERELRRLLGVEPEHAPAHALLAFVLSTLGELDEALTSARQSVTIDPEYDGGYHAIAVVQMERHQLDDAADAIGSAIELAPDDSHHFGVLAQIRFRQQRWPDALRAADEGLRRDPEDTDCLNLRSLALTKLGRRDEANATVEASLARDPDNPYTHQAQGFAMLQQGEPKRALKHFQEALRRDPTLDGARAGLVEAIKAQNPIYRWVLAPFVWMERFPPARQTQILIGAWFAAQVGRRSLAGAGYETAAAVVGYSWLAVVIVTACIVPIFNLLLLLHPIGRHALDKWSKGHALLLGGFGLAAAGMFALAATTDLLWASGSSWFLLVYLLPIAGLGIFYSGWGRHVLIALCVALFGAWAYWAFEVHQLGLEFAHLQGAPSTPENEALAAEFAGRARPLGSLHGNILLAGALSTWFVLLAPKGHRPRRRRS